MIGAHKFTTLDLPDLLGYAKEIGIGVHVFRQSVESNKYRGAVQRDAQDAKSKGVRCIPAFVIGKSILNGVESELVGWETAV
jgi:predicted DsbA family dithiol-disulfide isomerase